ncbi:MAG TPA: hypothetical protein VF665_04475 [Longimicrobium sp.]|jgi:hypothetical protein|uniref:hypothetical protein n=1 Tax=Longimicrobium sp. TaxID=2029185 RepID=UPI002EDB0F46
MKDQRIDAVAAIRRIREGHAELLAEATPAERIRFYREETEKLLAEIEQTRSTESSAVA